MYILIVVYGNINTLSLKRMKHIGKRGNPRNILQKYILKSQMNSLTRNYGVCDADRVPRKTIEHSFTSLEINLKLQNLNNSSKFRPPLESKML